MASCDNLQWWQMQSPASDNCNPIQQFLALSSNLDWLRQRTTIVNAALDNPTYPLGTVVVPLIGTYNGATQSTTLDQTGVIGVTDGYGNVVTGNIFPVRVNGTPAAWDYLRPSATAGVADATSEPQLGTFARVLSLLGGGLVCALKAAPAQTGTLDYFRAIATNHICEINNKPAYTVVKPNSTISLIGTDVLQANFSGWYMLEFYGFATVFGAGRNFRWRINGEGGGMSTSPLFHDANDISGFTPTFASPTYFIDIPTNGRFSFRFNCNNYTAATDHTFNLFFNVARIANI